LLAEKKKILQLDNTADVDCRKVTAIQLNVILCTFNTSKTSVNNTKICRWWT